jgi:hypothetical protein
MSSSKKNSLERDFAAGVYLSEAPPPLMTPSRAVGETRDRWIEAWIEGEASASPSLFSESRSVLELDEVFRISQKLDLDLAE